MEEATGNEGRELQQKTLGQSRDRLREEGKNEMASAQHSTPAPRHIAEAAAKQGQFEVSSHQHPAREREDHEQDRVDVGELKYIRLRCGVVLLCLIQDSSVAHPGERVSEAQRRIRKENGPSSFFQVLYERIIFKCHLKRNTPTIYSYRGKNEIIFFTK